MQDAECVRFLQWALPRMGLRWPGYRKVRRQVCRRVGRRLAELGLDGPGAYQAHLEVTPGEWPVLAALCRVTISRFWRDRRVFERLRDDVLPALARQAAARGDRTVDAWSLGCASGEEAWSVRLAWDLGAAGALAAGARPGVDLALLGTDVDPAVVARARRACYPPSSVRELPAAWRAAAFAPGDGEQCLRPAFRHGATFRVEDVREALPAGPFDLVLCRNLGFTYFDDAAQRRLLRALAARLRPGGALVLGKLERLPEGAGGFGPWWPEERIYRRLEGTAPLVAMA